MALVVKRRYVAIDGDPSATANTVLAVAFVAQALVSFDVVVHGWFSMTVVAVQVLAPVVLRLPFLPGIGLGSENRSPEDLLLPQSYHHAAVRCSRAWRAVRYQT